MSLIQHRRHSLVSYQKVPSTLPGLALAPSGFGATAGDLLVGNFGDGIINVYDTTSFNLLGSLGSSTAGPLVNNGLWGLIVGNGGNGGLSNSLYITAGPDDEQGGLLARIDAVPEPSTTFLSCAGLSVFAIAYFRSTRDDANGHDQARRIAGIHASNSGDIITLAT